MAMLTALQRCDRCGAQAVVMVDTLQWLSELLFCGHHYAEHVAELARLGVLLVMDDRRGAGVASHE